MPPVEAVELGVRIKTAMFRQGVSGQQLADALGIGRSTVSQKLHGRVAITVPELLVIADVLGIAAGDLLPELCEPDEEDSGDPDAAHAGVRVAVA